MPGWFLALGHYRQVLRLRALTCVGPRSRGDVRQYSAHTARGSHYGPLTRQGAAVTLAPMESAADALAHAVDFECDSGHYKHWRVTYDGPVATLGMDVQEDAGLSPDYRLKLNSYDL